MISTLNLIELLKNITILYIEDDQDTKDIMANTLSEFSRNILVAGNGKEAMEILKKNTVHLIMTDIEMPEKNGIEFIREVRSTNLNIPIIVFTAYSTKDYLLECINLNIQGYIQKPISYQKIKDVLYKIIDYLDISFETNIKITDEIEYDFSRQDLRNIKTGEAIRINRKELKTLEVLLKNKNYVVSYEQIEVYVWKNDNETMSSTALRTIVKNLRKKVPNIPVVNVSGIGYKIDLI